MAQANTGDFLIQNARLSFSEGLWTPSTMGGDAGAAAKYGCTLIIELANKTAIALLQQNIAKVVHAKWGDKGMSDFKAGLIKNPLFKGDAPQAHSKQSGELWAGFGKDVCFIRCKNNDDAPPKVWFKSRHMEATKEEVYSGCWGNAVLNGYTWEHPVGGRGVTFNIRMFQKTRDGESLGGRTPVDTDKWFVDINDDGEQGGGGGGGSASVDIFG